MEVLWLHIGAPKAGSTALQRWMITNQRILLREGVLYPGREERHQALLGRHHPAPETLAYHHANGRRTRAAARAFEALRMGGVTGDLARHDAPVGVISNEHFLSYGGALDLAGLKADLEGWAREVRVIAYIRDPYEAMISRSWEAMKSGGKTYAEVSAAPALVAYEGLLAFRAAFGALELVDYGAALAETGDLVAAFLGRVAAEADLTGAVDPAPANQAPSLSAALVYEALARAVPDRADRRVRPEDLAIDGAPFTLPAAAVRAARPRLAAQYDLLERFGLSFAPPDWEALPEPDPTLTPDHLAQVAGLIGGNR